MRSRLVFVVAVVVGLTTIGIPAQAVADHAKALDGRLTVARSVARGDSIVRDLKLPWRANMIGLSFDGAAEIEARGLTADGWTPWTELHADPDEAAEGAEAARASQQSFTSPFWVGTAERIQVRASAADGEQVRNLRLHYINTLGDARPSGPLMRAGRALRDFLLAQPAAVAEASATRPSIISRKQWGADEGIGDTGPGLASRVKMAFVHHTVNSNSYSKSESDNLVRGIYRYHVLSRDYSDIAYNFIVDRYGQIFEGRKGGIEQPVIGAHTLGFNRETTGMALLGTFTSVAPPSGMQTALKKLIAWKLDVHHVPVIGKVKMRSAGNDKYDEGEVVSLNRVSGHRDGTPTSCPGYETYRRLSSIRSGADAIGHPKIYVTATQPTTLRPDGDGVSDTARLTAGFSKTVSWTLRMYDLGRTVRRTWTGSGTSMAVTWDGTTGSGTVLPTGRYRWRIDATRSGVAARGATGTLYLVTTHPGGTLLLDDTGGYVPQSGAARTLTAVERASYFGTMPATETGPSERGRYLPGASYGLRRGTLIQGLDGTRYIYSGGTLRPFANANVFAALGYDTADLIEADITTMATPIGAPVNETTLHPDGTVVKSLDKEASDYGQKYYIHGATKRPISTMATKTRFRVSEVVRATDADLALPTGSALGPRSGALIADPNGGQPWLIAGSQRSRFVSWSLFSRMGYTTSMLVATSTADLAALPSGGYYG